MRVSEYHAIPGDVWGGCYFGNVLHRVVLFLEPDLDPNYMPMFDLDAGKRLNDKHALNFPVGSADGPWMRITP